MKTKKEIVNLIGVIALVIGFTLFIAAVDPTLSAWGY